MTTKINVSQVIEKANEMAMAMDPEEPLPFYEAARALGADENEADALDQDACFAVMRARGAF